MEWSDITAYAASAYEHVRRWAGSLEAKDVLTFLLALYGAILGTVNLVAATRKDRRSIRITRGTAFYTFRSSFGSELGPEMARFLVVNDAHRPIELRHLTLRLPNGKEMVQLEEVDGSTSLPVTLGDGQSATILWPYHSLADALRARGHRGTVKLRPVASDATGREFVGKTWRFNLDEWKTPR